VSGKSTKYSICITNRDNIQTIEQSLNSIFSQIGPEFEVVIVDAESVDGSLEVLERYSKNGRIRLIQKRCSRGRARQIAFEHSKGSLIISNIDLDDILQPVLAGVLTSYENSYAGSVLRVVNERRMAGLTICPRTFLESIGGWVDLNYVEDRYIWGRAAELGIYRWAQCPLYLKVTESKEKRGFLQRVNRIYGIQRDRMRLGAKPHVGSSTWPLYPFAYIASKRAETIARPIFRTLWPDDPKYQVRLA